MQKDVHVIQFSRHSVRRTMLYFYFRNRAKYTLWFGLSNYLVPYCEQYIHETMTDNALYALWLNVVGIYGNKQFHFHMLEFC